MVVLCVVFFDQRLGAALLCKKAKKANFFAKTCFFKFAPKRWWTVLFPKNELFCQETLCISKNVFLEKKLIFWE